MNEKICRLCLQTITNDNCQTIEESLVKTLKLKPNISKETVMCVDCANWLQVFSRFAPRFVYKGGRAVPLSDLKKGIGLDPARIEATSNLESLMETEIKCSFCAEAHGREDVVSLNESKENKFMVNILEQYILKMNLNNTEELLACGACLEKLEGVSGVILKCLEVEEKISKYIELKGTDNKGQIELKEVQVSMSKPGLKLEIESVGMVDLEGSCVHVKEEDTTMAKLEVKYETDVTHTELIIKTEDIKSEQSDCDLTDTKAEKSDCDGLQEPRIENNVPNGLSHNMVTSDMKECKKQHLLTHKNTWEPFRCPNCSYEALQIGRFKAHLSTHKSPMFKCELCSYKTKHKGYLKHHLLIHKSPSELKMFKCELCSYKTKHKGYLKQHLLIHKSPSELKMFKCALCSYEAKRKGHLDEHLLTHKSPSELKMFKCELCPYEAKRRSHIKEHLLTHKRTSKLKSFNCELCTYKAKHEYLLEKHLLIHKSPRELKMFKCELCSYESKRRNNIKLHLLTHKSPSELKMFKCELCSYEAKRKWVLERHLLTHKIISELKIFKCELCSYKATHKGDIKTHLLTHKSPSEPKILKCELCSYKTKHKGHFNTHLLIHKSPSELKMFKCTLCSYETKHKQHLDRHSLTHMSLQS